MRSIFSVSNFTSTSPFLTFAPCSTASRTLKAGHSCGRSTSSVMVSRFENAVQIDLDLERLLLHGMAGRRGGRFRRLGRLFVFVLLLAFSSFFSSLTAVSALSAFFSPFSAVSALSAFFSSLPAGSAILSVFSPWIPCSLRRLYPWLQLSPRASNSSRPLDRRSTNNLIDREMPRTPSESAGRKS